MNRKVSMKGHKIEIKCMKCSLCGRQTATALKILIESENEPLTFSDAVLRPFELCSSAWRKWTLHQLQLDSDIYR